MCRRSASDVPLFARYALKSRLLGWDEKWLYIGRAGPYELPDDDAQRLLVTRVEELISTEHAKWTSSRDQLKTKETPSD